MTSTLTFQEKFKDRICTIGKDGIFGLANRSEFSINKQKESNFFIKEKIREGDYKVNQSASGIGSSSGLFEIKETPIVKKESNKKQTNEESNLINHGNYIINNEYKNTSNNCETPFLQKNTKMNITNQTGFLNISQYNMWNQPSPRMVLPFIHVETNNSHIQKPNLNNGDLNLIRQNNFQQPSSNSNNRSKLNGVQIKQHTPVKVLEKINQSDRMEKEVNSFIQLKNPNSNQNTSQRSFSTRFTTNLGNNLSKIDENMSHISTNSNSKNTNFLKLNLRRAGSSEANRIGIPEAYKEPNRTGSSGTNRNQKHNELINKNNSNYSFKPYTLQEYKELGNEKIVYGGLGPNIGTKEWEEKANKMKKINEYSEKIKKQKKLVLKPIKEAPLEIIEKIKKERVLASNRTKASMYGKKINKNLEGTKNYFSENILNNNVIKNIYEDNRIDFAEMKEEEEEDDVMEFFKDDEIRLNNYDFSEELCEIEKKNENLNKQL